MKKENEYESFLKMEHVFFEDVEFKRIGIKNDNKLQLEMKSSVSQRVSDEMYRVSLEISGNKKDEYNFHVAISGYFRFETENENITEQTKHNIITKNSIAILMPYLRSEVSLLTAQPETDCVVLPPFNVEKMLE